MSPTKDTPLAPETGAHKSPARVKASRKAPPKAPAVKKSTEKSKDPVVEKTKSTGPRGNSRRRYRDDHRDSYLDHRDYRRASDPRDHRDHRDQRLGPSSDEMV